MGNGSSSSTTAEPIKQEKQQTIPGDAQEALYNELNKQSIELKEIQDLKKKVKQHNVQNPLIVCVSTKEDAQNITIEEKSNPDYFIVVDGETHREIKKQITTIIHKHLLCDESEYDAIIVLLQTICSTGSTAPDSKDKTPPVKFFYDRQWVSRHVEKLKKDIVYRLDDMMVILICSKTIAYTAGLNTNAATRPSPHMEQSDPDGEIVIWKAFENPIYDAPKAAAIVPVKAQQEKPPTDDFKEEQQTGDQ